MSTEENLGPSSGVGFDAEVFTKEIVRIITGESNALGVDNPELQLLACRCISNLVEALPTFATFGAIGSTRVIPALCAKLMSIEYIDVAEQAISTIERISREQTKDILKEGGVDAVLNFMDFFSLG